MKASEIFKVLLVLDLGVFVTSGQGGSSFKDKTYELGLKLDNAAVACIDYNNDGWVDLYSAGKLWKNNNGKSFSKVMEKGDTAVWADFDNDGYSDFYDYNTKQLFWNDHGKDFVPQSPLKLPMKSSHGASWADHNGDGYVDLYIGGYETWNSDPSINLSHPDSRVINLADPKKKGCHEFALAWEQPKDQLQNGKGRARGITSCDFDEDGDVDIYVSNYRLQPNLLWLNDGKGNFENVADEYGVAGPPDTVASVADWLMSQGKVEDVRRLKRWAATKPNAIIKDICGHTIGSAWADLNNDGHFDLFVGNFSHPMPLQDRSMFYMNMGPSKNYHFQDKSSSAGLAWQETYASPTFGDYDNDGDLDLYFTTAYDVGSFDIRNYPVLYRNDGNWHFTDITEKEGLSKLGKTYQAAWADINNDGHMDLITNGKVFINQGNANHWLKVHLESKDYRVNRDAIGAQVRIRLKDRVITRQVEAGTGEGNQNEFTLHFGLGKHEDPVDLEVFWPNGIKQVLYQVKVNRSINVTFPIS